MLFSSGDVVRADFARMPAASGGALQVERVWQEKPGIRIWSFIMAIYRRIGSSCMALSLSALALAPGPAWSSACNEEIVAEIHIATGDRCWAYSGHATTFMGKFSQGQNVEVKM